MSFQVSPGVNVNEVDLTTVVPSVSTTEGAAAGHFRWGPVDQRVLVTSEDQLVAQFQKPGENNFVDFFTAANFLSYSNALYVVRSTATGQQNATLNAANTQSTLVKNSDDYENNYGAGISGVGDFIAKYPGALGNSLKISVCPSAAAFTSTLTGTYSVTSNTTVVTTSADQSAAVVAGDILEVGITGGAKQNIKVVSANTTAIILANRYTGASVSANTALVRKWEFVNNTSRAPTETSFGLNNGATGDAMHIAIVDEDGLWTGTRGSVLEIYENVSKASDAKDNTGSSLYYKNVVNNRSRFVLWAAHNPSNTNAGTTATNKVFGTPAVPQTASFVNGADGSVPTAGQIISAYDKFRNSEDVDVSFIVGGDEIKPLQHI